mmetsp:Transcript_34076/g.47465  ORF Transcript_34076/g.47465 Transcript_34076/m.47465 type:complete len:160 (-) Transcript_34076:279-758(-)
MEAASSIVEKACDLSLTRIRGSQSKRAVEAANHPIRCVAGQGSKRARLNSCTSALDSSEPRAHLGDMAFWERREFPRLDSSNSFDSLIDDDDAATHPVNEHHSIGDCYNVGVLDIKDCFASSELDVALDQLSYYSGDGAENGGGGDGGGPPCLFGEIHF